MPRILLALVSLCLLLASPCPAEAADEDSFANQIAPILIERCLACHNAKKAEGGYRVDTYQQLLKAGESGAAPVTANDLDESELFRRISSDDEFERMPLDAEPLSQQQIETVRAWISSGANCEDALKESPLAAIIPPPVYPAAPEVYRQTLPITALAFTPDGSQLIVGGYHEATIWSLSDGKLVRRIGNLGQRVYGIELHPERQQMAVACGQPGRYGEVRIIDIDTGDILASLAGCDDVVLAASYDPKGERLAVAAADHTVRIYRLADKRLLQTITSHSDWVTAVAWSDDGQRIATASRDKTAKVFDADDGRSLITYTGHTEEVRGVAFHIDGKRVFTSGADLDLDLWKIADGKREKETELAGALFGITPFGKQLLVPSADHKLYRMSRDNGEVKQRYEGHADWVLSAAGHADSGRVAAGAIDGRVIVWDAESGELVSEFIAAPGYGQ